MIDLVRTRLGNEARGPAASSLRSAVRRGGAERAVPTQPQVVDMENEASSGAGWTIGEEGLPRLPINRCGNAGMCMMVASCNESGDETLCRPVHWQKRDCPVPVCQRVRCPWLSRGSCRRGDASALGGDHHDQKMNNTA